MKSTITVRSRGAIALGIIFSAGTAYVLLADVKTPADFTIDHLMTVLVMVGTIAAGHMFWGQAKAWRIGPAIGLAVLFASGTFYCVVQSAARNAEATSAKLAVVSNGNGERAKAEADLAEAKEDLRKAQDGAARECRSGNGPRCKGSGKAQQIADSHYWMLHARLEKMKPAIIENAGLKHAAKVFALFIPADAASIENALVLLSPFVKAAFLEVACVIFFGIGFGHRHPVPWFHNRFHRSQPMTPARNRGPKPTWLAGCGNSRTGTDASRRSRSYRPGFRCPKQPHRGGSKPRNWNPAGSPPSRVFLRPLPIDPQACDRQSSVSFLKWPAAARAMADNLIIPTVLIRRAQSRHQLPAPGVFRNTPERPGGVMTAKEWTELLDSIANVIGAVAKLWPFAVAFLTWVLRNEIKALIGRIKSAKGLGVEFTAATVEETEEKKLAEAAAETADAPAVAPERAVEEIRSFEARAVVFLERSGLFDSGSVLQNVSLRFGDEVYVMDAVATRGKTNFVFEIYSSTRRPVLGDVRFTVGRYIRAVRRALRDNDGAGKVAGVAVFRGMWTGGTSHYGIGFLQLDDDGNPLNLEDFRKWVESRS